jgi:Glyoxalase-like domain
MTSGPHRRAIGSLRAVALDAPDIERAALDVGATRLDGAGPNWRVYADPAGKPFCLVWTV